MLERNCSTVFLSLDNLVFLHHYIPRAAPYTDVPSLPVAVDRIPSQDSDVCKMEARDLASASSESTCPEPSEYRPEHSRPVHVVRSPYLDSLLVSLVKLQWVAELYPGLKRAGTRLLLLNWLRIEGYIIRSRVR